MPKFRVTVERTELTTYEVEARTHEEAVDLFVDTDKVSSMVTEQAVVSIEQITYDEPTIETQVWEPDTERPGYLKLVRVKTVDQVFAEIRAALGEDSPPGCNESFGVFPTIEHGTPWPEGRITVFPVTGGSEGHYTHVEVRTLDGESQLLLLGKTFDGFDAAWGFAKRLARLLEV